MSYCGCRSRIFTSLGLSLGTFPIAIYAPGTLAVAKLQIAINRIVPHYDHPDFSLVDVDGKMGTQTLTMLQRIANVEAAGTPLLGADLAARSISLAAAAASAYSTADLLNQLADGYGMPASVLEPAGPYTTGDKTAPPPPPPGTPGLPQPQITTATMVLAAVGVGVVLALASKKKGRRR